MISVKMVNAFQIYKLITIFAIVHEMAKIKKSDQSRNKRRNYKSDKRINGLTRTPGYTEGGIKCIGGESIPFPPITPAVSPVP
jgi:hypothetical protein